MDAMPEVHGRPPPLVGAVLEELWLQQYWFGDTLVDEANVVFFRSDGVWHRLSIDVGVIFCRSGIPTPKPSAVPEIEARYPVVDVGRTLNVRGRRVEQLEMRATEGGSEVEVTLTDRRLIIRNVDDRTTLVACPPADALDGA
jgi:hypothetical protein